MKPSLESEILKLIKTTFPKISMKPSEGGATVTLERGGHLAITGESIESLATALTAAASMAMQLRPRGAHHEIEARLSLDRGLRITGRIEKRLVEDLTDIARLEGLTPPWKVESLSKALHDTLTIANDLSSGARHTLEEHKPKRGQPAKRHLRELAHAARNVFASLAVASGELGDGEHLRPNLDENARGETPAQRFGTFLIALGDLLGLEPKGGVPVPGQGSTCENTIEAWKKRFS